MKILRSILPDTRIGDDSNLMYLNYNSLRESIFKFDLKEDKAIHEYISDFALQHGHLPDLDTVVQWFDSNNYLDEADRTRQIATSVKKPLYRGDFISEIEKEVEESRVIHLSNAMNNVKMIVKQGLEMKEGRKKIKLRGTRDASKYLSNQLSEILTPTFGQRIGGEALGDMDDFFEEYEKNKNKEIEILPITGLSVIDDAIGGFRKKELYIMAGFTGHMKSRSALNWVYTQAVYGRTSSLYFSLEMHYSQCRRTILCFHTMHPKFKALRVALGMQGENDPDIGLDPKKVRDGQLSDEEELFLREVYADFKKGVEDGSYGKIHFEVFDPDSLDFTVEDLRSRSELLMQKDPFKMMVVDHALLMSSRSKYSSTTERLNEVIRDLKKLASGFSRGEGIPILCLFQINREGFKNAEKNNGQYNLTHLSYANEAERSADVVIAGWFGDDMREQNLIRYQALKSRDQEPFKTFEAQVVWPSGRILNVPMNFSLGGGGSSSPSKDPLDDVLI